MAEARALKKTWSAQMDMRKSRADEQTEQSLHKSSVQRIGDVRKVIHVPTSASRDSEKTLHVWSLFMT